MKNKYQKVRVIQVAALGAFALAASPSAQAIPTIRISDGVTAVDIADGSLSDTSGTGGSVGASTAIGGWTVVITSGATKTLQGSATSPDQHLEVRATASSPGTSLFVLFSETGFGPTTGSFIVPYSTTLASSGTNSVAYSATYNTNNLLFGGGTLGTAVGTNFVAGGLPGFSGNGAFSNNLLGFPGSLAAPFSITELIAFTYSGGVSRTSSAAIDVTSVNVPDGGLTVTLLGGAMVGLAGLRRKLRSA